MFDVQIGAWLKSLRIKVKQKDGVILRKCSVVLEREFDDEIAAGLRGDARQALEGLRDGGMSEVKMKIDRIDAFGRFVVRDDSVEFELRGVQAVGRAADDDGMPPSISLEFEFPFHEAAWTFLGRHAGVFAEITFTQRQQELPGVVEVNFTTTKAKKGRS